MNPKPAFLIALLLLLPLAGCIDPTDAAGAIGTGTSSTDEAGNTTVWQNETYYVNETHVIQQTVYSPARDIRIVSGFAGECHTWQNSSDGSSACIDYTPAEPYEIEFFSIPENATASVLGGNTVSPNYVSGLVVCQSGFTTQFTVGATYTLNHIPTDGSECGVFTNYALTGYWSVIYEIHNATVD